MSMPRIVELSARIADNTAKVNEYLNAHHLPTPSFDVSAPLQSMIPNTEVEIEAARVAIIDDTLELRRLMLGPRDYLMTFTSNELLSQHAIVHFRLDHSFPVGSEASFAEIAEYSGLLEDDVSQIIRRAALQAMVKYHKSEEPNETGFALYNNTDKPIYEFFSDHPEKAHRFSNVMRALSSRSDLAMVHTVNGFDWGQLGSGTIVDVGGSEGQVAIAISRAFPKLSIIVQDLASVVEAGKKDLPEDLAGRVTFMTHDFLTPQPVQNAEVYLFRWILHNWSDKYCVRILRNLVPALKEGANIVVVDNVAPEPGSISNWAETRMRNMDLIQKVMQNSHERDLNGWGKVFMTADPRFDFLDAKQPAGSTLWIIVFQWRNK
ncbi:hypothetical protein KJ359_007088 [Pestalotiopsis sp. 9143b]|nr:hypothetical protein KJ359_007088 [Pestalotiopsis sp. 9143b]